MFKNHIKIAWRNLKKNLGLFAINVVGLSLGIASCLTIALFVVDELSYDQYNEKIDRIVRLSIKGKIGDEIIKESTIPTAVTSTLVREFPEVVSGARVYTTGTPKVTYGENTVRSGNFAFVDPDFFKIFTLPLIKGDANTALTNPNTIVLTKKQAETYFGKQDPIGKTLKIENVSFYSSEGYIDNDGLYTVTGIIEDVPETSHFDHNVFASMSSNKEANNQTWISGNYTSYLLMDQKTSVGRFESKLPAIVKKNMGSQIKESLGITFDEFLEQGNEVGLFVEPLAKVYFSDFNNENVKSGNIKTVYMFGAVALFMLLIACINFINLSTAGASKRLKEIGMRKVLGSNKKQLVFQFLMEAFISTCFAMLLGIFLFSMAIPFFNDLADKNFELLQMAKPGFLLILLGLTILISLMAGAYPAFFMSSFKPIKALKNRFTSSSSSSVRSGLVVFQFAISITLIIATLVVSNQMHYIQNKDLGYEKDKLIVIRSAGRLGDDLNAFKETLKQDVRVANVSTSSFVPAGPSDNYGTTVTTNHEIPQILRTKVYNIDEEYIPTLGIQLVTGRNFSKEFGDEQSKVIINETAIKTFGLKKNPLGETLSVATDNSGGRQELTVIGVVKDFHSRSLHEVIEPLLIRYNPYYGLIVKAQTEDIAGLMSSMQVSWDDFNSGETFEYAFLDELLKEVYIKEASTNHILKIFALLTILVACLGLFGLVTFTAEQRFKEIGIRKVLGSSVSQIVQMLASDFLKLVILAMFIAFPLGYYLMNKWLEDFSYRIEIKWWVYAISGLLTILIAFLTISFRSFQAAMMNPVKSLRTE